MADISEQLLFSLHSSSDWTCLRKLVREPWWTRARQVGSKLNARIECPQQGSSDAFSQEKEVIKRTKRLPLHSFPPGTNNKKAASALQRVDACTRGRRHGGLSESDKQLKWCFGFPHAVAMVAGNSSLFLTGRHRRRRGKVYLKDFHRA